MKQNTERNPTPETVVETLKAFLSCSELGQQYILGYATGQMAERDRWEKENNKKPA